MCVCVCVLCRAVFFWYTHTLGQRAHLRLPARKHINIYIFIHMSARSTRGVLMAVVAAAAVAATAAATTVVDAV